MRYRNGTEINTTYIELEKRFGIKMKPQLQNSEIHFSDLKEDFNKTLGKGYTVRLDIGYTLFFRDRKEFFLSFYKVLKVEYEKLENDVDSFDHNEYPDEIEAFYESEALGLKYGKYLQLIERVSKILGVASIVKKYPFPQIDNS